MLMRNFILLLVFTLLVFSVSTCKKKDVQVPANSGIMDLLLTNEVAKAKLEEYLEQTNGNIAQSCEMTAAWLSKDEAVDTSFVMDGVYVFIHLKSGLRTSLCVFETDANGICRFRGGSGGNNFMRMGVNGAGCSKKITNKKVLIYIAAFEDFYTNAELTKLLGLFSNSSESLEVTVLKNEQCTPQIVSSFKDYGLVILSTHGMPNGFMTGLNLSKALPKIKMVKTEEEARAILSTEVGEDLLNKIADGSVEYCTNIYFNPYKPEWWKSLRYTNNIYLYSSYIKNYVPNMPNTILFGNMCYSGYMASVPEYNINEPIGLAMEGKNLLAYYAYGRDDKKSYPVENDFAKACEDSLIRSLLYDTDSTGNAHLNASGNEFKQNAIPNIARELFFKQYGAKDYCFGCSGSFTDSRDGKTYKTVCIGSQVWMAENLNYNASGSKCYQNDTNNCNTYGKLYNWNTAMDGSGSSSSNPSGVRGICPQGWHLPSSSEWNELIAFLGGTHVAGGKMKATNLWLSPNTGATNSSGFTALPSGLYTANPNNPWAAKGVVTYFWSTTEALSAPTLVSTVIMKYDTTVARPINIQKVDYGNVPLMLPCRCVKD